MLETVSYRVWKKASLSIFKSRDKRYRYGKKILREDSTRPSCLLSKEVLKSGLQSDKATSGSHALDEWQVPGC